MASIIAINPLPSEQLFKSLKDIDAAIEFYKGRGLLTQREQLEYKKARAFQSRYMQAVMVLQDKKL